MEKIKTDLNEERTKNLKNLAYIFQDALSVT